MGRRRDDDGERRSGDEFGRPLADSMKKIRREIESARKKRVGAPTRKPEPVAKPAAMSDSDAFRVATAGASALAATSRRVNVSVRPDRRATVPTKESRIDLAADEHFDVRFSDLYIRGRAAGVSSETIRKLERGEFAVRSHVDLHGMAFDDAKDAVDRFLSERQKRGDRCVLVITGKGRNSPRQIAVLRQGIPEWLARGPSSRRVLAFVTARPCDGGEGALYVLLRKHASRKSRIEVEAGGGI